ncbi:copper chaperone PCu(A)C [Aquipseudomonas campi]|uniref:Copper chaperone PCu(A)C n=1 Tax=Aquipseudomonas campi TaxID=2731681 RepID=A0A6M8FGF9_9GAMM|nr:copper chaperone PCu(A)C [Pseudomonas campi]
MRLKLAALAMLALLGNSALAHEFTVGNLHIEHPWSRALPPNAPNGGAYFIVHNQAESADRLLAVSTPRAAKAELHTHLMLGDVMKMQKVDSVSIPAGGEARFAPGGNHVMLFGLTQPLVAGERFPLTLEFEKAGKVDVEVAIEAEAPADTHAHH